MTDAPLRWIIDRRAELPPVGDQGPRPTCFAWATTAAHDHRRAVTLSVEYLHWACGPPPDGRGTRPGITQALKCHGQPPDEQWPYRPDVDDTSPDYAPPASVTGPFRTAAIQMIDPTIDTIENALTEGAIPVAGLRVTAAFQDAAHGIIDTTDTGTDGHAVCLVGVVEATRTVGPITRGAPLLCVRNSWGTQWGTDGHALMTERAWTACSAFVLTLDQ